MGVTVELVKGRRIGIRSTGTGAPALLSHCSLAHSGAWGGVMAGLNDRLRMTAFDLPGHGESEFDTTSIFRIRPAKQRFRFLSAPMAPPILSDIVSGPLLPFDAQ